MGATTSIEWCDSTLNLMMGCDGCELSDGHCYAEALTKRMAGQVGWPEAFSKPAVFPARLETALRWPDLRGQPRHLKPWLDGCPRLIFVNDLGDTFTESLPLYDREFAEWLGRAIGEMRATPHVWILLTKRPQRMADFVEWWQMQNCERWPENVWGGVSVTGPETFDRLEALWKIPLAVKIVSAEPLLACTDFGLRNWNLRGQQNPAYRLDWMIVGGESGPKARSCEIGWLKLIVEDCFHAGLPCFLKQLGSNIRARDGDLCGWPIGAAQGLSCDTTCVPPRVYTRHTKGGDPSEWPEALRVRQMPRVLTSPQAAEH